MGYLIDSDVAIHLRDLNGDAVARLARLPSTPQVSIVTMVELEAGLYTKPELAPLRRDRLALMRAAMPVLPFDQPCLAAYGAILAAAGYSRRKALDRMIAATALAHGLTLITVNGRDFADIPALALEVWELGG